MYRVIRGLPLPVGRPVKRKVLNGLIDLAKEMNVGDAAVMSCSEAQQFRIILIAMGFGCVSDGYRCDESGKALIFKMAADVEQELIYEI